MRTVDFFIVGAMKSGTSSLRGALRSHPSIWLPQEEGRLFHLPAIPDDLRRDYAARYDGASAGQRCGDKSPQYGPSERAADRIRQHNPDARIIWMLRDPVARAISQYRHALQRGARKVGRLGDDLDAFDTASGRIEQNPVFRSRYDQQIPIYDTRFSRVLVCIFEDLVREPSRELARIQSFLDVPVQELELHRRNAAKPEFRETPIVPEDMARLVRLVAPARLFVEERLGRTIPEWHANE